MASGDVVFEQTGMVARADGYDGTTATSRLQHGSGTPSQTVTLVRSASDIGTIPRLSEETGVTYHVTVTEE